MFINEQDCAGVLQTSTFWKVKLRRAKNGFRTLTNCLAVFWVLFYDNYFYLRLFIAIRKEKKMGRGFHTGLFLSFYFFWQATFWLSAAIYCLSAAAQQLRC